MPGEVIRLFSNETASQDARPVEYLSEAPAIAETTTCRQQVVFPAGTVEGEGKIIELGSEVIDVSQKAA